MITNFDITFEDIHLIKPLWEKNRQYHEKTSEYFGEDYQSICFEERMKGLKDLEEVTTKVTVAKEGEAIVGYCISTIAGRVGELASMHVDESRRGSGIGKQLADEHLAWMREMKCSAIGVTVSQENASTIHFYRKLGFYPNTLYMQQLSK